MVLMQNDNLTPINSLLNSSSNNGALPFYKKRFSFLSKKPHLKIIVLWSVAVIFLGILSSTAFLYRAKTNRSNLLNPNSSGQGSKSGEGNDSGGFENIESGEFKNYLNGAYISESSFNRMQKNKPVTVMINNHTLARPAAGLSQADIVYEIVAEGGITRFLAVFASNLPEKVGPVRSMRKYFQQVAAEYFPISTHWGIAYRPEYEKNLSDEEFAYLVSQNGQECDPRADARSYLDELGLPTLDQTALPGDVASSLFYKDSSLALPTEHTAFIRLNTVYENFVKVYPEPSWLSRQDITSWNFIEGNDPNVYTSEVTNISYNFWDMGGFQTSWKYISDTGMYERTQGEQKTIDRNNNKMVPVKTVILQKAKETKLNDVKSHMLYDVIGSGDATIYLNGKKILAKWSKSSARSRTLFTDLSGKPIYFNRGLIWVAILPDYSEVVEN